MASGLLESFGLLFESDASDLQKDIEGANKSLDSMNDSMKSSVSDSTAFAASLSGLGSEAQDVVTTLGAFGDQELDINDKVTGLKELQQKFSALSDEEAIELGQKLGLDAELVQRIKKGGMEFDNLVDQMVDIENQAEEAGGTFDLMINKFTGFIAGAVSIGATVGTVISAAARTDEVGKFSQTLGLSIEDVSAWGEAVVRSGGDSNAFMGSIQSLTESLTEFTLTGGGAAAETLARLGVDAVNSGGKVKTAFEILPELADKFAQLDAAESFALGQRLGLDQGTILLLQQGRVAVDELVDRQKKLGVATQEDYEIAAKFNDKWADTQQVLRGVAITAGSFLLPILTDILSGAEDVAFFLADHEELVKGFFIGAAGAITYFFLPAMLSAAAATLAAISPFLAVGLAIGAIGAVVAVVWEDIQAFLGGQSSLIGDLSKEYPLLGQTITFVADAVGVAIDAIAAYAEFLFTIFTNPKKAIEEIQNLMGSLADQVKDFIPDVEGALDSVSELFSFGDDEEENVDINKYVPIVSGEKSKRVEELLSTIDSNPLNSMNSNSISNSSQSVQRSTSVSIARVDVNTKATDSESIYRDTSSELNRQMQIAVNNFDDGVEV